MSVKVRVPAPNAFSGGCIGYVTNEDGGVIARRRGIKVLVHETSALEGENQTVRAWFLKIVR